MNPILSKNFVLNNKFYTILLFLIFLIPLSLIIGNAATNINIILITIFFLSKLTYDKNLKFLIYDNNLAILIFFVAIAIKDNFFYEGFNLKSIYLIKFYFLFLSVSYIFNKKKEILSIFTNFLLIILVIFSFDIAYQYNFGRDILNIASGSLHRYSGFMGTEWIAGSYISKFALISLLTLLSTAKYKYINIFLILLYFLAILISGERMALINYFFTILIFISIFTYKKYFRIWDIFLIFFVLALSFAIFFQSLDDARKRIYTIDILLKLKLASKTAKVINLSKHDQNTIEYETKKNNTHFDIFASSIKIFKKNYLIGTGTDKFLENCQSYEKEELYCESHSHNIYLNILSEQGIIIFLMFIYVIYFILFSNFSIKKNQNYLILLIVILIFLNPLSVGGDIFSTWTGTVFWYIFGICNALGNKKIINEK